MITSVTFAKIAQRGERLGDMCEHCKGVYFFYMKANFIEAAW